MNQVVRTLAVRTRFAGKSSCAASATANKSALAPSWSICRLRRFNFLQAEKLRRWRPNPSPLSLVDAVSVVLANMTAGAVVDGTSVDNRCSSLRRTAPFCWLFCLGLRGGLSSAHRPPDELCSVLSLSLPVALKTCPQKHLVRFRLPAKKFQLRRTEQWCVQWRCQRSPHSADLKSHYCRTLASVVTFAE